MYISYCLNCGKEIQNHNYKGGKQNDKKGNFRKY